MANDAALVHTLKHELGCTQTFAELLVRRGFTDVLGVARFLDSRLKDLTPPDAMLDLAKAAQRIARALRGHETICVFGDYDCDGITATAILSELVGSLGGRAVPLLANRFDGGYGVSGAALERIRATGCTLLITCDCGSSDHAALRALGAAGVDTVVIDHHLVPEEPLPALAFLNPHRPECGFAYKGLASCGLALVLGTALRKALAPTLDLRRWLDLVAIGTIADVAPLDGDNRALVRAGLTRLSQAERPGIRALFEQAGMDVTSGLSARDVAFRIAPRLNAPGRLGSPALALELLIADDLEHARALAVDVESRTTERKLAQAAMFDEAVALVEAAGPHGRPAIVVGRQGWNHGIVGVVAGRLAEKYERPVIVVGFDGPRGIGSVRGPEGARLHDAVSRCAPHLVRFGGHQAAAGLEVTSDELENLRHAFERACREQGEEVGASQAGASRGAGRPEPHPFVGSDSPEELLRDLRRLEPCGQGNPAPSFLFDAEVLAARAVKGGHLKLEIALPSGRLTGFGPELGERAAELGGRVRLVGNLRPDTWRGGAAAEIEVSAILEPGAAHG